MSEAQNGASQVEANEIISLGNDVRKMQRLLKKAKKTLRKLRQTSQPTGTEQPGGLESATTIFGDAERSINDFEIALLRVEHAIEHCE